VNFAFTCICFESKLNHKSRSEKTQPRPVSAVRGKPAHLFYTGEGGGGKTKCKIVALLLGCS